MVDGMTSASVTVGVDTTPGSLDALAWAIGECRAGSADLVLLHSPDHADAALAAATSGPPSPRTSGAPGMARPSTYPRPVAPTDPRHAVAQAVLDVHRSVAEQVAGDVTVSSVVSDVSAAQALIEASRSATLIVLGSRGPMGFGESALGSVGHRVAVHVHCPVVVVPHSDLPAPAIPTGRIVVGVSGTPADGPALAFAAERADRERATLVLVCATHLSANPDDDGVDADALLRTARVELAGSHPDLVVLAVRADTDAVSALVAEAARADLVVLGCHHSDDRWDARLGAVPVGVLARATRPVVLVGRQ